jgi:hypothetical protein
MLEGKFVRFRRLLSPQTTRARVTEGWLTAERSAEFQNLNVREPGESEIASSTSEFGLKASAPHPMLRALESKSSACVDFAAPDRASCQIGFQSHLWTPTSGTPDAALCPPSAPQTQKKRPKGPQISKITAFKRAPSMACPRQRQDIAR